MQYIRLSVIDDINEDFFWQIFNSFLVEENGVKLISFEKLEASIRENDGLYLFVMPELLNKEWLNHDSMGFLVFLTIVYADYKEAEKVIEFRQRAFDIVSSENLRLALQILSDETLYKYLFDVESYLDNFKTSDDIPEDNDFKEVFNTYCYLGLVVRNEMEARGLYKEEVDSILYSYLDNLIEQDGGEFVDVRIPTLADDIKEFLRSHFEWDFCYNNKMKKKELFFGGKKFEYFLRKSKRAKKIRIEIKKNGEIFLVVPKLIPNFVAIDFLRSKIFWILEKQKFILEKKEKQKIPELSQEDFLKYKDKVKKIISERVKYFAKKGDFAVGKITIKNNKTNWGSCSSMGNLNFNYRLIFLEPKEMDYIIVHELSHLKEMNHSKKFWAEVKKLCPEYKEIRKRIKNIL